MNQSQRKYAAERLDGILARRKRELEKRFTKEGKSLTSAERCSLLRSGKIKLLPSITKINEYTDVCAAFDFSKYEYEKVLDEEKFNAAFKNLVEEMIGIKDELFLGDAEHALNLIKTFDK